MQSLCIDTLALVVLECNWRTVLLLSQVDRYFYRFCESMWDQLYKKRYKRVSLSPKETYRKHVFLAGTVMSYDTKTRKTIPTVHGAQKYFHTCFGPLYINVHNECIFRNSVILQDVLDIDYTEALLYVLTTKNFTCYTVCYANLESIYSLPITMGKRIIELAYCETNDGEIYVPRYTLTDSPMWQHVTKRFTGDMQLSSSYGPILLQDFKQYNIIDCGLHVNIVLDDSTYITSKQALEWAIAIPVQAKYGVYIGGREALLSTNRGELCLVTWITGKYGHLQGVSYTTEDTGLIGKAITYSDGKAYYIKL